MIKEEKYIRELMEALQKISSDTTLPNDFLPDLLTPQEHKELPETLAYLTAHI